MTATGFANPTAAPAQLRRIILRWAGSDYLSAAANFTRQQMFSDAAGCNSDIRLQSSGLRESLGRRYQQHLFIGHTADSRYRRFHIAVCGNHDRQVKPVSQSIGYDVD